MKALITGGSGFLGRYIAERLLARGDQVTIFGRSAVDDLQRKGARWAKGDIRDRHAISEALTGHDTVFHVAAHVGMWGAKQEFIDINIGGTKNIIHGCREAGIQRLVFTSSPSVIYAGKSLCHADETLPYPESFSAFYPQTKARAEQLVIEAAGGSLAACSLRPHLLFGPRDNHLIPTFVERAKKRQLIMVGDGENLVDFTYVENAAQAHILAADKLAPGSVVNGQCYFISQDEPIRLWEFIARVLTRLGLEPPKRRVSRRTARVLGTLSECAYRVLPLPGEPRLTAFLADQLSTSHYFSNEKARAHFGYVPEISLAEGIERLAEFETKRRRAA